ncbi:MAG: discoidin domain-containing protein [Spirochaetales bacterium]|nr:discoidin domain-containing protein [Spirochaetales bacterium]
MKFTIRILLGFYMMLCVIGCYLPNASIPMENGPTSQPASQTDSLFKQGKISDEVLNENVQDITQALESGMITYAEDKGEFTYSIASSTMTYAPDQILYVPAKFLARKITEVQKGDNLIILKTVPAELFELYKSYSFSLHKDLTYGELNNQDSHVQSSEIACLPKSRSGGQVYSNQLFYELNDVKIGTYPFVSVNGTITVFPSMDINWRVVNNQLVSLHFVTSASFQSDVTFRFGLVGELNYEKALVGASFKPIETPVGTFIPKLGIMLGVDGKLDVTTTIGGSFSGNVTAGCKYENSRWNAIGSSDISGNLYKDDCLVNFKGDVKAYFGPRLNLEFQSITGNCLGFYADMLAFLEAECDNLVFKFYRGALVEAGVKESLFTKILGKAMPDIKYTVIDSRELIDTLDKSGDPDQPLRMYLDFVYNKNNELSNPPGFYTLNPPLHVPDNKDMVFPYGWTGYDLVRYRFKLKNISNVTLTDVKVTTTSNQGYSYAFGVSKSFGTTLAPCADNNFITFYPASVKPYFAPDPLTFTVTISYKKGTSGPTGSLVRKIIVQNTNRYKESFPRTNPFKHSDIPITTPKEIPEPFPTPDIPPLLPPATVNATDNLYGKQIQVTWSAVERATHYRVYRMLYQSGTSPSWDSLYSPVTGWIATTTFTDTQVGAGNKYAYRIKAAGDAKGYRESGLSSYDMGLFLLKTKMWYATDSCNRLDVWADVWSMGQNPHWGQARVYDATSNAYLGLLSTYHTNNGSCNLYYPGSSAWPGSTYRFHNSYTQFRQKGLPRYIKVDFFNNVLAFSYSDMSNALDLNTGRRNMAHKKPIILHDGTVGPPYAGPNSWLALNDGDWKTNWLVHTNYPNDTLRTKAVIDLESVCTVNSLRYSVYWDSNYGSSAQIQVKISSNNASWQTISDSRVTNNQLIDLSVPAISGRYVRIEWVAGSNPWNGWGGINELEIYGKNVN